VQHAGLPDRRVECPEPVLQALRYAGLISMFSDTQFILTPSAFDHYGLVRSANDKPIQRMEDEVRAFLNAQRFRDRFPLAYRRWAEAANMLWEPTPDRNLTNIGHICRETLQAFATALVDRVQPEGVDGNPQHDVARINAVLNAPGAKLGTAQKDFLTAYWGTVTDLAQRQEHGGQREAEPLDWEDARRLVFQTAMVMFEFERAVSAPGPRRT